VKKLMINYPIFTLVNDELEVIGIVWGYDVLDVLTEKGVVHEFSAESLMSCGHVEDGVCTEPLVAISVMMRIDGFVSTLIKARLSILTRWIKERNSSGSSPERASSLQSRNWETSQVPETGCVMMKQASRGERAREPVLYV